MVVLRIEGPDSLRVKFEELRQLVDTTDAHTLEIALSLAHHIYKRRAEGHKVLLETPEGVLKEMDLP